MEYIIPEEERLVTLWVRLPYEKLIDLYDKTSALWQAGDAAYLDRKLILLQIMKGLSGMDRQNISL